MMEDGKEFLCWIASNDDRLKDTCEEVVIPKGRFVTHLHIGDYSGLSQAWEQCVEFMNQHNLTFAGKCFEKYLNDPSSVKASELETEICIPVIDK
ncbi:hypothetical protein GEMRC1_007428 [Eukaryota sp. GEM-RC1]